MPANMGEQNDMVFLVGGYDEDDAYGTVFQFSIPTRPEPAIAIPKDQFGAIWGGQREITDRLMQGFDPMVPALVEDILAIPPNKRNPSALNDQLRTKFLTIPWQFLPLQDCVDLAMFVIRTTIGFQRFAVGIRGVGGAIDVATITRTDGFTEIQTKKISGEKEHPTIRSRT